MSMDTLRVTRVPDANAVLSILAQHGRRLFYCKSTQKVSQFVVDPKNSQVWLVDAAGARIYTSSPHRWLGFSEGPALRPLIEALRDYIRNGTPVDARLLGLEGDDPWGYGESAMEAVRRGLLALPENNRVLRHSVEHFS